MLVEHPGHIPIHLNSQGVSELLATNGSVLLVRNHQKATQKRVDSLVTALCKRFHRRDGQFVAHTDLTDAREEDALRKLVRQYGENHFMVLTRGGRDPLPLPPDVTITEVEEEIQKEKLGGLMLPDKSAEGINKLQQYTPEKQRDLERGVRAVKQREREAGEPTVGSAPVILRTPADVRAFAKSPGASAIMLHDDSTMASQTALLTNDRVGAVPEEHQSAVRQALNARLHVPVILTHTNANGKTQLHQYTGPMEPHSVVGALANLRNAL
jgi:hypothetical protein